ncbi:major royal jelly protein 1-like [Trichogramma pretiosum]|uniref:major royal jelly protein 1-like n=1 Tax=Trichogramma pretiosum TaxID=7493 RepID=UPI0006C979DA|nr:major royal jelly protein 1-like [Trichogramma pretiosum]
MQGFIWLLLGAHVTSSARALLITQFAWKYLDYNWDSQQRKNYFVQNGLYDYRNLTPIDVDQSADGRTFITVIRGPGVPASVHTVSNRVDRASGPLLEPYPNWSWYRDEIGCEGIINVYRVAIDKCQRLWVLDTGLRSGSHICPAKLLAFNLRDNKLIYKTAIPDNVAQNRQGQGQLVTPIVQCEPSRCQDVKVYMADVAGSSVVVFDSDRLGAHRIDDDFRGVYTAEPAHVNTTIAGESFTLADGVLGMALSPRQSNGDRYLAFRPFASLSVYFANTRELLRPPPANSLGNDRRYNNVHYLRAIDVLPSQATAMAFSSGNVLFYGLTKEIGIGCYNFHKTIGGRRDRYLFRVPVQDYGRLQFVSGMKIIQNPSIPGGEEIITMSNRLQKIYAGTQNFNEVNFQVSRISVKHAIQGTMCDSNNNV